MNKCPLRNYKIILLRQKKIYTKKGENVIYLLSREKREEVCEFISEQLRKGYIRLSKLPQIAPVLFCRKEGWQEKDGTEL